MRALSATLTLEILVLPFVLLSVFFLTVVFWYRTELSFSTIVTAFSTFLSAILVNLLVWERLRDSLSKKLEYLDDYIFLDLLSHLQNDFLLIFSQDEIRTARDDLKRHARFMNISLYPRKLLKKLDEFLLLHEDFYGKWLKIIEAAEKIGNPDREVIRHYLDPLEGRAFPPEQEKAYIEAIESKIEKDGHLLVAETKASYQKTKTKKDQIPSDLIEFLKCNSLKLGFSQAGTQKF